MLDDFLRKSDWQYEPLDIAGVYNQVVFPYCLARKPAELPAQWDACIQSELDLRSVLMSETEYSTFYKERHPVMQWSKDQYLVEHRVNALPAMSDMLKLIRENPTHPDAGDWARKLREFVNAAKEGKAEGKD